MITECPCCEAARAEIDRLREKLATVRTLAAQRLAEVEAERDRERAGWERSDADAHRLEAKLAEVRQLHASDGGLYPQCTANSCGGGWEGPAEEWPCDTIRVLDGPSAVDSGEVRRLRARLAEVEAELGLERESHTETRRAWDKNASRLGEYLDAAEAKIASALSYMCTPDYEAQEAVRDIRTILGGEGDRRTCGCAGKPFQVCDICQRWDARAKDGEGDQPAAVCDVPEVHQDHPGGPVDVVPCDRNLPCPVHSGEVS